MHKKITISEEIDVSHVTTEQLQQIKNDVLRKLAEYATELEGNPDGNPDGRIVPIGHSQHSRYSS